MDVLHVMVPANLGSKHMSYRPLTAGVSAGSSLALALKILNFDHQNLLDIYRSVDSPHFDPWSFICGLLCGLVLYALIEWAITLRWCLVQWVQSVSEAPPQPRRKELYRLL